MLTKFNRLTKEKDFENVFRKGEKYRSPLSKIYLKVGSNNLKQSRFGFIINNKVSKKAVVRNKIKRKLRETIRNNLSEIKKGVDVAVVVLPGFKENNLKTIGEVLNNLLKKAKII